MKVKDRFTFVITYTFDGSNRVVADGFKAYLQSTINDDGFEAIGIDQSTYASKRELITSVALNKLRTKLDELYRLNGLRKHHEDQVNVLCNPFRGIVSDKVSKPEHIYQYDVFDF